MSQELYVSAGDHGRQLLIDDEFYVCRINWLIALGRTDLIDEIADDCERRSVTRHTTPAAHTVPEPQTPAAR